MAARAQAARPLLHVLQVRGICAGQQRPLHELVALPCWGVAGAAAGR